MSTLEKAIGLLQIMPEHKLEAVYMYMRFVHSLAETEELTATPKKTADSIIGIAHQYADINLIPLEKEAFANAMGEKHAAD